MNSEQIASALDAYRDGSLAGPEAEELATAIRAGGTEAAAILAAVAGEGLIGQALDPVPAGEVVRMVRERLRAEGGRGAFVAAWRRRRQPVQSGRRWLAAAALVAAVIGAWLLFLWRESLAVTPSLIASNIPTAPAPRIEAVEQAVLVQTSGGRSSLSVGQVVAADAVLELAAAGSLRLRHDDGTVIVLDGPGRARWTPEGVADRWTLEAGGLVADVAARSPERSLGVRTAQGLVSVHGTRLRVAAAPGSSSVAVEHGEVSVVPLVGPPLNLDAGDGAVLTATGARRLPLTTAPLISWDFSEAELDSRWHGGQIDPGPVDTPRRPCLAAQTFNHLGSMGFQLAASNLFTYTDEVALTLSYWADPGIDHLELWLCSIEAGTEHWYTCRLPQLDYGRWRTVCIRLADLRPERAAWPALRAGDVVVNVAINLPSVQARLYLDDLIIAPLAAPFVPQGVVRP